MPVASEPAVPEQDPVADAQQALPERATPEEVVLVHLEGSLTDREATDVVMRNPDGAEVERFRVPGAVGIWASPGAGYALVHTLPGGWARFDATTRTLALVAFPGDVPGPTIQAGTGVAGPTALWDPLDARVLLRMDTGTVTALPTDASGAAVRSLSPDGGVAVLDDGDTISLLTTSPVELRTVGPDPVGISANNLLVARPGAEVPGGTEVLVEGLDGSDRRVLGVAPGPFSPIPLVDGRVLLAGPSPALMAADGVPLPLAPAIPIRPPITMAAGTVGLATTDDGLAVVDVNARTITALPETAGWASIPFGSNRKLWALSLDPGEPGALVVDPVTGVTTRFLQDVATQRFLSVSADGSRATVLTEDGTAVLDVDGTTTLLTAESGRVEAYLHPDGVRLAEAVVGPGERSLRLSDGVGEPAVIETGRNPVWLTRLGS